MLRVSRSYGHVGDVVARFDFDISVEMASIELETRNNHIEPQESGLDLAQELASLPDGPTIDTSNAPVHFSKDTWRRKTMDLLPIAVSVTMGYAAYMMLGFALLTFVGRLGEIQGAAAGLGNFYIAVTGQAVCVGLLSAQDTLTSQAFGAGALERVSIVAQRSGLIMAVVFVPIAILWCFTTPLLIALKQDPDVAAMAGHFVLINLFSFPFTVVNDMLRRYLLVQGIAQPTLYTTAAANVICTILGYFLIFHSSLQFYGMPVALSISNVLQLTFLTGYTLYTGVYKATWRRITMAELFDWKENFEYIKLGVPGALVMAAEWIGFEIHGLMSYVLFARIAWRLLS